MRSVDLLLLIMNVVFSVGGEDSARSQARCSCRPDVAGRDHAQVTGGGNERPPAHVRRGVRFRRAGEEFEGKGAEGNSASCGGTEAKETKMNLFLFFLSS